MVQHLSHNEGSVLPRLRNPRIINQISQIPGSYNVVPLKLFREAAFFGGHLPHRRLDRQPPLLLFGAMLGLLQIRLLNSRT